MAFKEVHCWVVVFYWLKLWTCECAILFPASPCANSFAYEDDSAGGDRWYGELTINPTSTVTGLNLRITLDRPSHLLVTWNGPVMSNDNKVYNLYDPSQKIEAGSEMKCKIMVKFDPSHVVPLLHTVHFNGRRICPPDLPLTLSVGETVSEASSPSRPDLEFTEPTDVFSDVERKRTTTTTRKPINKINDTNYACGLVDMVTPLITHGARTLRGQWPWHVALYKTEGVNLNYKCGATLVSKNKVITAAHCVTYGSSPYRTVNPNQIILYLGKHKLHQFLGEEGVQTKQVSRIVVHPGYSSDTYYGDIAILTLSSDVNYTSYVRPVCLWEPETGISDIEGREGSVVGWGLDENENTAEDLKVAKLPVVSSEACLRSFPQFYSQFTSNATFCAGFRNGTSPCNGDSGGGMVFNRNSTWYLRGVVSLSVAKEGLNFCDPRYYVTFTDIAKFRDFIDTYM